MEPLYKDLSYEIVGAAFEVHNELGCGFWKKCTKRHLPLPYGNEILTLKEKKESTFLFIIIHSLHPTSVIFVWKTK